MSPFIGLFMFCVYGALKSVVVCARRQDFKDFFSKFFRGTLIRALLFIFILCFTSIARTSYRALLCIEVEGVSYLKGDMSVVCWSSSEHASIVAWASLGFFQIAILPLMLAALVKYRVKNGSTAENDRLTGFLYDSFREDAPAWEALRLYRKALLCAVLMIDGLVLQAMTAMALITTSVVLTAMFSPFRSWLVNALDILGQLVLVYVLCMSSALFFSGNVNSSLQQSLGAVLASLIILVVLSFIAAIVAVSICKKREEELDVSPSEDDYDSQCVKDPESGTELAEVDSSKNSVVSKLKAQLVNKDAQLVNKDAELVNNRAELVNKEAELVNKDAELDGLRLRLKSQEFPQE